MNVGFHNLCNTYGKNDRSQLCILWVGFEFLLWDCDWDPFVPSTTECVSIRHHLIQVVAFRIGVSL